MFKINVSSAWIVHKVGIGGFIRDHQGRMWIFFSNVLPYLHLLEYAATITIRDGLRLTERFDYTNSILESHCKVVIN